MGGFHSFRRVVRRWNVCRRHYPCRWGIGSIHSIYGHTRTCIRYAITRLLTWVLHSGRGARLRYGVLVWYRLNIPGRRWLSYCHCCGGRNIVIRHNTFVFPLHKVDSNEDYCKYDDNGYKDSCCDSHSAGCRRKKDRFLWAFLSLQTESAGYGSDRLEFRSSLWTSARSYPGTAIGNRAQTENYRCYQKKRCVSHL